MLCASLPLISIQIQVVSNSLHLLNNQFTPAQIAAVFCIIIALFAILFGARRASLRNSHSGLVVAIAIASLIKLLALLGIALFALYGFFGGFGGLENWLQLNPELLTRVRSPQPGSGWQVLVLAFFTAAIVMPHMFHLAFTENISAESLYKATWVMPLYMLLLALCVPLILWAALASDGPPVDPQFVILQIGDRLGHPGLTLAGLHRRSGRLQRGDHRRFRGPGVHGTEPPGAASGATPGAHPLLHLVALAAAVAHRAADLRLLPVLSGIPPEPAAQSTGSAGVCRLPPVLARGAGNPLLARR